MRQGVCRQAGCGILIVRPEEFCDKHEGERRSRWRPGTPQPVYQTAEWKRLSKRIRAGWVREHGWVCPGWRRDPHMARTLHAAHRIPLVYGGAALDPANVGVLCAGCNARQALSERKRYRRARERVGR